MAAESDAPAKRDDFLQAAKQPFMMPVPTTKHSPAKHSPDSPDCAPGDGEPVRIPITGDLDLHTFQPRETARVIDAYIEACLGRGIGVVRIIHGKGTGTLRETVHAHLRRHPSVESFRPGDENSGGWGATLAHLRK